MIITKILGGLGNQMFQYAVGRSLALKTGQELKLDLFGMQGYASHALQLDQFNVQASAANAKEIPIDTGNGRLKKLLCSLRNKGRPVRFAEKGLRYDPAIGNITKSAYLTGYWQSEKYFREHAETIRQDFSLKYPLSAPRQAILADIKSAKMPVSVHVRRGDYVSNPTANSIHGTCSPEWYATAIPQMMERVGDATFFVFSDDPQWARANLPGLAEMIYVDPQTDRRDGEDMHLMAACHSHIIANSTFSWWGAWLNPREYKHIIAPARWFQSDERDDTDLIPINWLRLNEHQVQG